MQLVLIRHGQSEWNKQNRFTGWTDVDLSEQGELEAKEAGKLLKENKFDFDICYTSYLKRAIHTLDIVLDQMDRCWLPVNKCWELNEKHYGALQGLNKEETAKKYGDKQVLIWRRSFDSLPPLLLEDDQRDPATQDMYRNVDKLKLPLGESLKLTIDRVVPVFETEIKPKISAKKRVLIVAHGNSLRALVKYLEKISNQEIVDLNIPTGIPLVLNLNDDFQVTDKYYLGDASELQAKIDLAKNARKK